MFLPTGGAAAGTPADQTAAASPVGSKLSNGLTLVTAKRPDAETVAMTLAIQAGARFEDDATAGSAHFLEHMYLQGTRDRPTRDDIMRTVTSRGGTIGVSTGWEFLDFSIVMAPEDVDVALELLHDLLASSTFDPDRMEHQRGIILRELAERRDTPTARAFDLFFATVFRDHELRHLPSGLPGDVEQLDRDSLLRYRDHRIVPPNMTLGIVSPFDDQDVLARVESTLGSLPPAPMPSVDGQPPPAASSQEVQLAMGRNQAMVVIGSPAPGLNHPDRYPLWLLQTILGPGGGRLFYDIRDVHGLAYDTSMRLVQTAEAGSILVYAGTDPAGVEPVTELLHQHLARARDELVSESELEDAVGYLVGGTVVGLESGSAQAGQLSHNVPLGLPISTAELEARLRAVTREDIQRVARAYLSPERLTRVVIAPGE